MGGREGGREEGSGGEGRGREYIIKTAVSNNSQKLYAEMKIIMRRIIYNHAGQLVLYIVIFFLASKIFAKIMRQAHWQS